MDCREFCEQHVAYVDDTLAGIELVRMQRHIAECESCAKHDAKIRRALLVFRNLPSIEPSADFSRRLEARIRECQSDHILATAQRNLRYGAVAATMASVIMLGYIGTTLYQRTAAPQDLMMPPVVASIPEPMPSPVSEPAFVASMSAGIPVWPTLLMMEQAPMHMANVTLQQASLTR